METVEKLKVWSKLDTVSPSHIKDFLDSGHRTVEYNGLPVLQVYEGYGEDDLAVVRDGVIFPTSTKGVSPIAIPYGVFINDKLIVNGDMSEKSDCNPDILLSDHIPGDHITISFLTLVMLINNKNNIEDIIPRDVIQAAKMLASGEIKILDALADRSIKMEQDLINKIRPLRDEDRDKYLQGKAPEPGMTPLFGVWTWHRPASVLFSFKNEHWLMSIDEESYFGVVLAEEVDNIPGAFLSLIPKEIRDQNPARQGEWFIVPVNEKIVPRPSQCLFTGVDNSISLPVEHDDSNRHVVRGDFRVTKDGQLYATHFALTHYEADSDMETYEHVEKSFNDGWYTFVRNTALRSVSAGGVD